MYQFWNKYIEVFRWFIIQDMLFPWLMNEEKYYKTIWQEFIWGFIRKAKCANTDETKYGIYRPQLYTVNKTYLFKSVGKL